MEQIIINQNDNQLINLHSNEPQLITLSNVNTQDINIKSTENQELSLKEKENQILYINEQGSVIGITDVLVNGISVVSNNIAYVIVPTKVSQLQNDSGYITNEIDPTVPYYIKEISISDINSWNNKQNLLISGSNIKTINNNSLLGSGNLNVGGADYTAGTGISIDSENVISNTITSYNDLTDLPTIPSTTSDLTNDSGFVSSNDLSVVAFTGSYDDLIDEPTVPTNTSELVNDSGYIDKNVNDLTYYTLSSNLSTVATSGDYDDLLNKPTIPTVNNATLTIQKNGTNVTTFTANSSTNETANITVPTNTSDLNNDSGFITNNYEIYSTTETRVGTWINNEALYRKVIDFGALPNNARKGVSTGLSNVSYLNVYGMSKSGTNFFPINLVRPHDGLANGIGCYIQNDNVYIETGSDRTGYTAYVVIEYIYNS